MTFRELWPMMSPFVAAILASSATYAFSRRGKRDDLLLAERMAAFGVLKDRLLSLSRYCKAFAAEIDGGDFDARLADLPDTNRRSALLHRHDIQNAVDERAHLLSQGARKELQELDAQLGLLCSMNVTASSDEIHSAQGADMYRHVADAAMKCIDHLYAELHLPR
jgi:hypothetical protein